MKQPKLRPAIIYEDGKVYVEFTFEKFAELLEEYYEGDMVLALEAVETQLRNETRKV